MNIYEKIIIITGGNHRLPYKQEHFIHKIMDTAHVLPEKKSISPRTIGVYQLEMSATVHVDEANEFVFSLSLSPLFGSSNFVHV